MSVHTLPAHPLALLALKGLIYERAQQAGLPVSRARLAFATALAQLYAGASTGWALHKAKQCLSGRVIEHTRGGAA